MTPSKAILFGSGIIAVSIVAAALVLPDGALLTRQNAATVADANQQTASPRFQIIKTEQGRTWRLDTQTGKITVCQLRDDRMICADSTTATQLPQATPEQLEVLGIPAPGDSFWTDTTLRLTQERWPDWDMQPYREAHQKGSQA